MQNNETPPTRGQLIRSYRRKLNLTQEAAADMMGVSRVSLSQWERDRIGRIHPYNIERIAHVLGIDTERLRTK